MQKGCIKVNEQHIDSRYQLIEMLAYWQGLVNSSALKNYFDVSRTQAQKYLTQYQQAYPNQLIYDKRRKGFVITPSFVPTHISGNANEYLDWIHAQSNSPNNSNQLTNATLNVPKRSVQPDVIRMLVQAINQKRRLEVDYVSLTRPDTEGRIIQPTVFVCTGLRWHLRAYDEKNMEFRDFVLSRFLGKPELLDGDVVDSTDDEAWHTFIDLKFVPDPRLTPMQKKVIEHDYQMDNGELIVNTRAALAHYVLQEMNVNIKFLDEYPEAQQLVLANKSDIKKWLFNG